MSSRIGGGTSVPGEISPGERRRQLHIVVASVLFTVGVPGFTPSNLNPAVFGEMFLAAPCDLVPLDDRNESFAIESSDATCPPVNMPNGVRLVLFKDTAIEVNAWNLTGSLKRGQVYIETYTLPFELTDVNHLVDPENRVVVGIQNVFEELLVVQSVEGESAIFSCASENSTCSLRQMYVVPQGELIALRRNGSIYARQDQAGVWTYPKSGCSFAGHSGGGILLLGVVLFALIFLASRRRM